VNIVLPDLDDAYSLAVWLTDNPVDAEDVVQDACLHAFCAVKGFAGGNARAWILTISPMPGKLDLCAIVDLGLPTGTGPRNRPWSATLSAVCLVAGAIFGWVRVGRARIAGTMDSERKRYPAPRVPSSYIAPTN
jgi:hypothetical protein